MKLHTKKSMLNINDRNIVLYGNKRFVADLRYVFEDLKSCEHVETLDELRAVVSKTPDCTVVLCFPSPEDDEVRARLKSEGIDFMKADDFIRALFNTRNKEIVVWGAGNIGRKYISEHNDYIKFIIDRKKTTETICGKEVFLPDDINLEDYFIVVATCDYWLEIKQYLEEKGLTEGIDFAHFKDFHNLSEMLIKTIHSNPVANVKCHYPFDFCQVIGGGWVNLCCLGMKVAPGQIVSNTFAEVWNSLVAKVLRVSIINKTFCFCDSITCPVIYQKKNYAYDELFNENDYLIEQLEFPREINVSIDHTCNLKCEHCRDKIMIADESERQKIDLIADRLIDEVLPHVEAMIIAGNGEVFFSETYKRICSAGGLDNKRDSIGILTNGTLFSEDIWEDLKKHYKRIGFSLSIDAFTEETYRKVRGGNFKTLVKNIKFLSNLKKRNEISYLHMNFVVRKDNAHELIRFIQWAKGLNADRVRISRVENWVYDDDYFYDEVSIFDRDGKLYKEYIDIFKDPALKDPIIEDINIKFQCIVEGENDANY